MSTVDGRSAASGSWWQWLILTLLLAGPAGYTVALALGYTY